VKTKIKILKLKSQIKILKIKRQKKIIFFNYLPLLSIQLLLQKGKTNFRPRQEGGGRGWDISCYYTFVVFIRKFVVLLKKESLLFKLLKLLSCTQKLL